MARRILDETTKSTFASDDYLYMDGQTDGASKITPDNLVRNTTVAQQLAQHIEDAEDAVEQITTDIEGIQSDISDVNGNIGDLEDLETEDKSSLVGAINEARGTGGGGSGSGGIAVVSLASEMTDTSSVYLYNGTETGYTAGHWYFYNTGTSAWTDGGQYTGWETVDTALENFLDENAQEMGVLTVVVGSTTYTYNGSANVSITLPTYNGGVS